MCGRRDPRDARLDIIHAANRLLKNLLIYGHLAGCSRSLLLGIRAPRLDETRSDYDRIVFVLLFRILIFVARGCFSFVRLGFCGESRFLGIEYGLAVCWVF